MAGLGRGLRPCGGAPPPGPARSPASPLRPPLPDILVSADGQTYRVRVDGRLAILRAGGDSFAARDWLAAGADPRAVTDESLGSGLSCDESGCIGPLSDGWLVAIALLPDAFEEDCARAALVHSRREAPPDCAARVLNRTTRRQGGALALYRTGDSFMIVPARPPGYDRPWARAMPALRALPPSQPARDATPPVLEADD